MAAKARTKDFGATKKIDDFEPLNFVLNGETFNCKPAIQGSVLLEFVADADSDQGGRSAGALYGFFKKTLLTDDYTKFEEMVRSEDVIVDLSLLGDIAGWLVEEYTARPTSEPKS
jgi:hypothetical protein